MITLYIDSKLPNPSKDIKEESNVKIINEIEDAEYIFLYLHQYPSMNLRFQEFEGVIKDNPQKKFILFSWLNFNDSTHYFKVFAEYFTPERIGMWRENVHFFQLPKTIKEVIDQFQPK